MRIGSRIQNLPTALRFLAVCSAIAACGFVWLGLEQRFGGLLNGTLLTLLLALQLRSAANSSSPGDSKNSLELPFALARDATIFGHYEQISRALLTISQSSEPVYRSVALQSIEAIETRLERVAQGTIDFDETETWRIVYEQLLRSPAVFQYRSVALIENETYWQDGPGRKSLQLNLDLVSQQKLSVERIAIIADELWPPDERLPSRGLLRWIDRQFQHGIRISLIRKSGLERDRELIQDMGIYGSHVVGYHDFDFRNGTKCFTLTVQFRGGGSR